MKRNSLIKSKDYLMKFYFKILNNNLLKIWIFNLIFMQNNALIHNINVVKLWFKEHNINFINWLSYSFNLNFIEHF